MLVNFFNYGFHFVVSRKLGVVDYGDLFALFAALGLMTVPVSALTLIVVRFAAEFHALNDRERMATLFSWVWRRTLIPAVIIAGVVVLSRSAIAHYLHLQDERSVIAWAAILALSVVVPAIRGILQGTQDFRKYAISTAIEGGGKAVLGIGFVLAGGGVLGALAGYACAIALSLAYTAIVVRRDVGSSRFGSPLNIDLRRLVVTSAGVTLATLALTALGSLDGILVKHYFNDSLAGLYGSVSLIGKILLFVIGFVPTILLPKVTAAVANRQNPINLLLQGTVISVALCGTGLALLAYAPGSIVGAMVGPAFLAAVPLVFQYGLAMTLLGATGVLVAYKLGAHRFEFVPYLLLVAIAEFTAISIYHDTLLHVIHVLIVGNAVAMFVCSWRLSSTPSSHATPNIVVQA